MTVNVLVCRPDGTQVFEEWVFPEGWFDSVDTEEKGSETEEG